MSRGQALRLRCLLVRTINDLPRAVPPDTRDTQLSEQIRRLELGLLAEIDKLKDRLDQQAVN